MASSPDAVKALTPPLPSVLPMTAMTPSAANWPLAIAGLQPDASLTVFTFDLRDFKANISYSGFHSGLGCRSTSDRSRSAVDPWRSAGRVLAP